MHELLGTMGLFACLWSALQGLPLELATLQGATWSAAALAPFIGFGLAMFAFYRWGHPEPGATCMVLSFPVQTLPCSMVAAAAAAAAVTAFHAGGSPLCLRLLVPQPPPTLATAWLSSAPAASAPAAPAAAAASAPADPAASASAPAAPAAAAAAWCRMS